MTINHIKIKSMFISVVLVTSLVMAGGVLAESMFIFDPNDLIDLYTTGQSGDYDEAQSNPRMLLNGSFSSVAATYTDHPISPFTGGSNSRWTGNADYYADWVAGLGSGEGIRSFNIWITTANYMDYSGDWGNPYSRIDSKQELYCGTNSPSIWLNGSASGDWHVRLIEVWDDASYGPSYGVQWYTTNSASYLRPGGVDLDQFSFTMTDVWTGSDTNNPQQVADGQQYYMYFGSTGVIFDDQGWGTSSGLPALSSDPDVQWQGEMIVTAQVVPEPSTVMLSGVAAMALLLRKVLIRYNA